MPANWRRPAARPIRRRKLPPAIHWREALEKSADDDFVVITGSLYLVGEALELLGLSPAGAGERGLNEWSGAATAPRDKFAEQVKSKWHLYFSPLAR